jgi:hypothetical protein
MQDDDATDRYHSDDSPGRSRIRRDRPRTTPIIIGLFFVAIVAAVLLFGNPLPTSGPEMAGPPIYPPGTQRVTLRLYFAGPDGVSLVPESRAVIQPPDTSDQIAETVRELINGPTTEGLARILPPDTKLRQVFVTEHGTAYVNFGPEIVAKHPGGASAELLTVYGLVDTLERNFPDVHEVAILVDGHELPTLAGHIDLSRPLTPRTDLINDQKPAKPAQQKA